MNTDFEHTHPSEEAWAAWLEGDEALSAHEQTLLEEHAANCDICGERIAALESIEMGLRAWSALASPVPESFAAGVLASLPEGLYGRVPARRISLREWLRAERTALVFLVSGVLLGLLSGDALAAALGWWQQAQAWLGNVSTDNGSWLTNLPGGALESHLGLLPAAALIGVGALLLIANDLRVASPRHRAAPRVHSHEH